jgi:hypothetical protein
VRLSLGILAFNCASYIEELLRAGRSRRRNRRRRRFLEHRCDGGPLRRVRDKLFRLEPIGTSERPWPG